MHNKPYITPCFPSRRRELYNNENPRALSISTTHMYVYKHRGKGKDYRIQQEKLIAPAIQLYEIVMNCTVSKLLVG